jgi:hypothetical protein
MQLFDEEQIQPFVPENRLVTGTVGDGEAVCYDAVNTITMQDFNLAEGGEAIFVAGYQILFEPEVYIEVGSYMHARITQDADYFMQPPALTGTIVKHLPDLNYEPAGLKLSAGSLEIYPNPSAGFFGLLAPEIFHDEVYQISTFNTHGRMVHKSSAFHSDPITINLSGNPPGLYLIRLVSGEKVLSGKLTIN